MSIDTLRERRQVTLAMAAIAIAVVLASTATAAEDRFRILRFRPGWTSSACVGDPKTPLCAVETQLACALRDERDLCRKIGWQLPDLERSSDNRPSGAKGTYAYLYRVTGRARINDADIPDERRDGRQAWRPGDLALRLDLFQCSGSVACRLTQRGSPTGRMRDCPPSPAGLAAIRPGAVTCNSVPALPSPATSGTSGISWNIFSATIIFPTGSGC